MIRKVRRKEDGYVCLVWSRHRIPHTDHALQILCRKEINYLRMSAKEREQLHAELSILKSLRHPNIVAYYEREHIKSSQELHIYMEYCEQGDLGRRIRELKQANQLASEDFVWGVFTQVICGLYRCHYGDDPPPVGSNVVGLSSDARPLKSKAAHNMILHRDLKPENIFLGADASVKLGDFGLSKIISSHDFASTYVGTPFYMSPELCMSEAYNTPSDIWAFGCIMYELCTKAPPFNAKSHIELVGKIRAGKIDNPISHHYSSELRDTISKCLRLNPLTRPDAVQLLNLTPVKLKRKELEVVAIGKQLDVKEKQIERQLREAESQIAELQAREQTFRVEIENQVRREWEVKARLEIDRQYQLGMEQVWKNFNAQVEAKVAEQLRDIQVEPIVRSSTPEPADAPRNGLSFPYESQSTSGETEAQPSSTELSSLSLESPTYERSKPVGRRAGRTPFGRAQTMFDGHLDSPMDVQMADPSPAPIASLGLSPRRQDARNKRPSALRRNIFDAELSRADSADDEDGPSPLADDSDDDTMHILPSPTRPKAPGNGDPFKSMPSHRPSLGRQKTTTAVPQPLLQPPLFNAAHPLPRPPSSSSSDSLKENRNPQPLASPPRFARPPNSARDLSKSPSRRHSKLPSASSTLNVTQPSTSPTRHAPASPTRPAHSQPNLLGPQRLHSKKEQPDMRQAAVQGRTLVELSAAQRTNGVAALDFADVPGPRKAAPRRRDDPPCWDPERDDMPSPFLARTKAAAHMPGALGGPGLRHLR